MKAYDDFIYLIGGFWGAVTRNPIPHGLSLAPGGLMRNFALAKGSKLLKGL